MKNGVTSQYQYDHAGMRIKKTVGSTVTDYRYAGGLLISEKIGSVTTCYCYDSNANLIAVTIGGTLYFYVKNLQGDIIGLVDASGNTVVEYTYDSWGNVLSITGSLKDTVGVQNPFRYRGYYYDTETGMYYLQSRYYDPEFRRFISADNYMSTGKGILDTNIYIYCENNPINHIDSTGHFAKELWSTFQQTMQGASGYFAFSLGVSQSDTVLPGPADIVSGVMILGGVAVCAGYTAYNVLPKIFSRSKEKTKTIATTAERSNSGNIYYHVTTPDRAAMIMTSKVLMGSEKEGGYVFAWKQKPNKYAIKNSGASFGTIISFKTNAAFERDWGIEDSKIKVYEPVISVFPGPIAVWDVQIVGG